MSDILTNKKDIRTDHEYLKERFATVVEDDFFNDDFSMGTRVRILGYHTSATLGFKTPTLALENDEGEINVVPEALIHKTLNVEPLDEDPEIMFDGIICKTEDEYLSVLKRFSEKYPDITWPDGRDVEDPAQWRDEGVIIGPIYGALRQIANNEGNHEAFQQVMTAEEFLEEG